MEGEKGYRRDTKYYRVEREGSRNGGHKPCSKSEFVSLITGYWKMISDHLSPGLFSAAICMTLRLSISFTSWSSGILWFRNIGQENSVTIITLRKHSWNIQWV